MRANNKKIMEKFTKSKLVAQIAITSFVAALAIVGVAYATTIGTNILTTGTLTVDTNTLYVDITNDKVGVGTTTPLATLSIDVDELKSPFVIGSSTSTYLTMSHDGNLTVDAGTLYVDALNNRIGIGTTTPTGALSITSTNTYQGFIAYNETNYLTLAVGSGGDLTLDPTGNDILVPDALSIGTSTASTYALDVYGDVNVGAEAQTNTFRIDTTNGRVGVGTSTPSFQLSVGADAATSTIGVGRFCMYAEDQTGNVMYITLNMDAANASAGIFATSTIDCRN
ncbi:MAG: hypothetical protein WC619_03205 [Patescibacteria group bacterium]